MKISDRRLRISDFSNSTPSNTPMMVTILRCNATYCLHHKTHSQVWSHVYQ